MSNKETLKDKFKAIKSVMPKLGLSEKADYLKKLREKLKKKKNK